MLLVFMALLSLVQKANVAYMPKHVVQALVPSFVKSIDLVNSWEKVEGAVHVAVTGQGNCGKQGLYYVIA